MDLKAIERLKTSIASEAKLEKRGLHPKLDGTAIRIPTPNVSIVSLDVNPGGDRLARSDRQFEWVRLSEGWMNDGGSSSRVRADRDEHFPGFCEFDLAERSGVARDRLAFDDRCRGHF